jgi:hypothetical protein
MTFGTGTFGGGTALTGQEITLQQLEQEVARRTGPYFQAAQDSGVPTSSTATSALMPILKSSALLGGPENLWLLRRGQLADGSPTPSPIALTDRQRLVQAYDSGAGRVIVERNWGTPMYPSELAEFSHLDPAQELRVAVLAGLRRCFSEDRGRVYPNLEGGQIDLTSFLPWLTDPSQCLRLQAGYIYAGGDIPFEAVRQAGHVLIVSMHGGAPYSGAWLTALRPAWSWVNEAESSSGPLLDTDTLAVDLDYAASAAHIEAWHRFPSRMFAAAAGNLQATQEMAAREFTRQALIWGPEPSREIGFKEVVRMPL